MKSGDLIGRFTSTSVPLKGEGKRLGSEEASTNVERLCCFDAPSSFFFIPIRRRRINRNSKVDGGVAKRRKRERHGRSDEKSTVAPSGEEFSLRREMNNKRVNKKKVLKKSREKGL